MIGAFVAPRDAVVGAEEPDLVLDDEAAESPPKSPSRAVFTVVVVVCGRSAAVVFEA